MTGAALVPGGNGEVLLELGQVAAHRSEFGAARTTGEEQQYRVVEAVAADHECLVVAVDVDGDEFGDTAVEHRTVRAPDRVGPWPDAPDLQRARSNRYR